MYIKLKNGFFIAAAVLVIIAYILSGRLNQMLIAQGGYDAERAYEISKAFNIGCYVMATICIIFSCIIEVMCGKRAIKKGNYLSPYYSYEALRRTLTDKFISKKYSLYENALIDSSSEINVYFKYTKKELNAFALISTDEMNEENSEALKERVMLTWKRLWSENKNLKRKMRSANITCLYCVNHTTAAFKKMVNFTEMQSQAGIRLTSGVSFDDKIVYITRLADRYERAERGTKEENRILHLYCKQRYELCKILGLKRNMLIRQTNNK